MRFSRVLLATTLCAVLGMTNFNLMLFAALSVFNGDFQTDGVPVGAFQEMLVADWFNTTAADNVGSSSVYLLDGGFNSGNVPGGELPIADGDTALFFDNFSGYVYQSIGTLSAGTTFVEVEFDAMERTVTTGPAPGGIQNRQSASWQFQVFAGPFATAADGNDIASSLTPISTVTVNPANIFATAATNDINGIDPELVLGVKALLNVSSVTAGTQMWLRASSPNAADGLLTPSAHLDNVSVTELQFVLGDVNGDGHVNSADFNIISANMFTSVANRIQGDLNGDHFVDFADFRQWKDAPETLVSSSIAVPEPVGIVLAVMSVVICGCFRRTDLRRRIAS